MGGKLTGKTDGAIVIPNKTAGATSEPGKTAGEEQYQLKQILQE